MTKPGPGRLNQRSPGGPIATGSDKVNPHYVDIVDRIQQFLGILNFELFGTVSRTGFFCGGTMAGGITYLRR